MQCSDCGYISFKKEKACGACGFKFKKSTQSSQSLAGKESFSIFAGSVKGQIEDSPAIESVGLLDEQEPTSFIDPETGDFNLDLPVTSEETIEEAQISPENTEYEPLEFDLDEDIELEEVEGLGLEPTLEIGEPEETVSHEPVLEIGEPEVEDVALDLSETEVALDLDDSPSIPPAPPVKAAPLDEIELKLEIDDSDGPLTVQSQDIPDLEIEDLGLELESSDDPEPNKP